MELIVKPAEEASNLWTTNVSEQLLDVSNIVIQVLVLNVLQIQQNHKIVNLHSNLRTVFVSNQKSKLNKWLIMWLNVNLEIHMDVCNANKIIT